MIARSIADCEREAADLEAETARHEAAMVASEDAEVEGRRVMEEVVSELQVAQDVKEVLVTEEGRRRQVEAEVAETLAALQNLQIELAETEQACHEAQQRLQTRKRHAAAPRDQTSRLERGR